MPRVIISSGHTSKSPGTIANGLREYDVAKKIARAILPHLRQNGIISLSVPPDMDLVKRIDWINNTGYKEDTNDIALEIHINDGGKSGLEAWFEEEGENNSKKLADAILSATSEESKLANLGSKSEYDHELGSLAFLHEAAPTTCLIEAGYLDNEADAQFLKSDENIAKLGKGIARGVLNYYGLEFRDAKIPAPVASSNTNQAAAVNNNPVPAAPARPTAPAVRPTAPVVPAAARNTNNSFSSNMSSPASGPGGSSFGGFDGGFNPLGNPGGARPGGGGAMPSLPSREERKEIITKNYVKLLGREPNQNDLNYFLNIGITEDQLIKKIVDSQEHADLVKARQEVLKVKKNYNAQQSELATLRAQVTDQNKIITNIQNSVDQKNHAMAEMQMRLNNFQKINASQGGSGEQAPGGIQKQEYKGSFLDRLFRMFSDLFE